MKNKLLSPRDFLDEAIRTVDQRGNDNGYDKGQERSAAKIAAVFNTLTGKDLSEADVWTLLIVLKLVRNDRKYKVDNIVDLAGYVSLLGECLNNEDLTARIQAINEDTTITSKITLCDPAHPHAHSGCSGTTTGPVDASALVDLEVAHDLTLDAWGKLLGVPRYQVAAVTEKNEATYAAPEPDIDYRRRLMARRTAASKPVVDRPHVTFALAHGLQLDAYALMQGVSRRRWASLEEDDSALKKRLEDLADAGGWCWHPTYSVEDEKTTDYPHAGECCTCGQKIRVVRVHSHVNSCPACGEHSYEGMGGMRARCADCGTHYDLKR